MKNIKRFILPVLILVLATLMKSASEIRPAFIAEELFGLMGILGSILLIAGISWVLIAIIRTIKKKLVEGFDMNVSDNLRMRKLHTQYNILEKVIVFILIIIALGVTLMQFDGVRSIGISIFASAGIAGLIIGLAAQKALGTILAGLQIAITQPIRLDDVVIVENEWGWIEEINLTYVVIRIWDKRRLVVPSTYFLERAFQNWTRTSAEILGTVFIYTDYTLPVGALRDELSRILRESSKWDGNVNVLQVTDARENTLEIRALMSAANSPEAWDLRVYVREKLIEYIQREYPHCLPKTRLVMDKKPNQ